MNKRILLGVALSMATSTVLYFDPRVPALSVPAFLFGAGYIAVLAPGYVVGWLADALFHMQLREGTLKLLAVLIWFFPVDRLRSWAGIYDPFKNANRRRSAVLSAIAYVINATDKRLFGRQKTGGWA